MCCWMGSHFHDWTDYHGVTFSIELVEWGGTFSEFGVRQFFIFTVSKRTKMSVLLVKSKCSLFNIRYIRVHKYKVTKNFGIAKMTFAQK